jgi:hypothetical protein
MKILKLSVAFLFMFCFTAFAQEVAPAAPTYLDAALKAIGESSAIVAGLLMVFEFILRIVPTAKPLSLLVPAQYAFAGLGAIFTFLGGLVKQLIDVANRTK